MLENRAAGIMLFPNMNENPLEHKITKLAGKSMQPTLREGDILFLDGVAAESIKQGDLAVFKQGEKLICHRIVGKKAEEGKTFFLEKGDNCFAGGRISADQVIGRVSQIYRGSRKIDPFGKRSALYNVFAAYFFRGVRGAAGIKKKIIPFVKIGIVSRALTGLNRRINAYLTRTA